MYHTTNAIIVNNLQANESQNQSPDYKSSTELSQNGPCSAAIYKMVKLDHMLPYQDNKFNNFKFLTYLKFYACKTFIPLSLYK